jgi:arsenite methyltransferase
MKDGDIRRIVKDRYGHRAKGGTPCCESSSSCCGSGASASRALGYTDEQLRSIPEGADLGLGCGNPSALASLRNGESVLDLGSGAGIDCFLAAQAVGQRGRVIGVDMTGEMIDRARENARRNHVGNVEFRLGEIEHLPVADRSVDVVISNCVINLSPDKPQVFREAYRALKPGGRMFVSDIVLLRELPDAVKESIEAYVGCVAGASMKADYLAAIEAAGFQDVEILKEASTKSAFSGSGEPTIVIDGRRVEPESLGLTAETLRDLAGAIVAVSVKAIKP